MCNSKLLLLIIHRKYTGYEGLASFMGSDQDFMGIRRFDKLHTRVLLHYQARISLKEHSLHELEEKYRSEPDDVDNGTVLDSKYERTELLRECTDLLNDYDRMVLRYLLLAAQPISPKRNIKNLQNWFDNNRGAIADEEADFISHDDLIWMSSSAQSPARKVFDDWMPRYTKGILRCFARKRKKVHINDINSENMFISDDTITDKLATMSSFLVGLSVIVIPLWTLWILDTTLAKLIAVTMFILVFLLFCLACTVASPLQVLAATAA
jgi:hypothetical protein